MENRSNSEARTRRTSRWLLKIGVLASSLNAFPAVGFAATDCPWINEATAAGLLGGDATGVYSQPSNTQPATCTFVQRSKGGTHTLRIEVRETPEFAAQLDSEYKVCGMRAAALTGIGNEARLCSSDDRKKLLAERVVGRVRDQVFTITLSSTFRRESTLSRDELKARIYTAAEQVAGNLF